MISLAISPKSSLDEIEAALRGAGLSFHHVSDWHFQHLVLLPIASVEEADAFLCQLNDDSRALGIEIGCFRARLIQNYLHGNEFWRKDPDHIRAIIAQMRQVRCRCHEYGSFNKVS